MACHCVVLDLFDEALFQTICYDPEKWLANLLKVVNFSIMLYYLYSQNFDHIDETNVFQQLKSFSILGSPF